MKLLVATKETQGQRKNDFCHVPEGEVVHFGFECDGETVDGGCGCRRSMCGLGCSKATTTMKVEDVENFSEVELLQALADNYIGNWGMKWEEASKRAKEDAEELIGLARHFPTGRVVEKRGNKLRERSVKEVRI